MITSRNHSQIKAIRKLLTRKGRHESGLFLVEGVRQVIAVIESPYTVQKLLVAPDLLTSPAAWEAVARHRARGGTLLEVAREVFAGISIRDNPQGIAAVAHARELALNDIDVAHHTLWVALIDPQDPGNLGTIARTCDAVGAGGIILVGEGVDPWHPTAIRASAGAMFSRAIVRSGFAELRRWSRRHGIELVGTSDAATSDYWHYTYANRIVLVMGSERQGMPPEMQAEVDQMVRIPMTGSCDSLNLAVATSVMLYEVARQQLGS